MAHWAKINEDNVVTDVVVTSNEDPAGDEGYQWLIDNLGGTWIKTSYNTLAGEHKLGGTPLRKNFAAVGFTYDSERDAFLFPKPFPSWVLHEETCTWNAPINKPEAEQGKVASWNEELGNWEIKEIVIDQELLAAHLANLEQEKQNEQQEIPAE